MTGALSAGELEGRSERRARARLHALNRSRDFARQRVIACDTAADAYAKTHPGDPYWERSERCAANEARHIAEFIESAIKQAENEVRRASAPNLSAAQDEIKQRGGEENG